MFMDVYVGFFDDTFDWGGWSSVGNAPTRRSPFFPDGRKANDELQDRIKAGVYEGRQVDWGAWVAKVNRQQILDFIKSVYSEAEVAGWAKSSPHWKVRHDELVAFVETLDPNANYALTASEL